MGAYLARKGRGVSFLSFDCSDFAWRRAETFFVAAVGRAASSLRWIQPPPGLQPDDGLIMSAGLDGRAALIGSGAAALGWRG